MRPVALKDETARLGASSAHRHFDRLATTGGSGHPAGGQPAHLALFYESDEQYLDGVMDFLGPGLEAGDPIAVAVPRARVELLSERLGPSRQDLQLLDMLELGRNPARIIPAMHSMLERHENRMLHYVGEPVWPGRSAEEVREAIRHEALINLAWPGASIRVLCPYDTKRLDPAVLRGAENTHAWVIRSGATTPSDAYTGSAFPAGTDNPLPDPPASAASLAFGVQDLTAVRALVTDRATAAGLSRDRVADFVIAVNEVATNAIRHGGSGGLLRVWCNGPTVLCQLDDAGHIADPLAGRRRPQAGIDGGIGLWMVNQLCDLVEVRTARAGTSVRLHARAR